MEASTPVADPGAEQAQPGRGQGAGVEREQPGARVVEDPEGAPDAHPGAGADRVDARRSCPRASSPDQRRGPAAPARRTRRARRAAATAGPAARRSPSESAPRTGPSTTSSPASTRERRAARRPATAISGVADQPGRVPAAGPARATDRGRRAARRSAGEPDQYSPAGTSPDDQRARARPRRPCPTTAPGRERAAGADPGAAADPDLADVEDVAVDPVAAQVDLGLDRGARRRPSGSR